MLRQRDKLWDHVLERTRASNFDIKLLCRVLANPFEDTEGGLNDEAYSWVRRDKSIMGRDAQLADQS